jgi:channel protein (hemolysin III family)
MMLSTKFILHDDNCKMESSSDSHLQDNNDKDIETAMSAIDINNLDRKTHKIDHRLFQDCLLYCEGASKPKLRGILHLMCSSLFPFGIYHLVNEANGSYLGRIAAIVYPFTNLFCYGFSALYHTGKWSIKTEILLQKLDHCGIALLSCGTFFPASLLLLDHQVGFLFFITTFTSCLWTCYNIFQSKPSSLRQIFVIATLLPFMPFLYPRMNYIEFWGTVLTIVFQVYIHKYVIGHLDKRTLKFTRQPIYVYLCKSIRKYIYLYIY